MLSRVADSLYWMSRYLERAEHSARLMGVHMNLILEQSGEVSNQKRNEMLIKSLAVDLDLNHSMRAEDDDSLLWALCFSRQESLPSILSHLANARENARQVREEISTEMWNTLNQFYLDMTALRVQDEWLVQPHRFFTAIKTGAHLFQGITDSTMNHNEGWHFIQLGRAIERTISIANLLDVHMVARLQTLDQELLGADTFIEWLGLLKSVTAFEAYTKVYQADLLPECIAEFLLFNPEFPHSVRFSVESIMASLNQIADSTHVHRNSRLHRSVGRLQSNLSYDEIGEILAADLHEYLKDITIQSVQIHNAIYETYIAYPIESALK